MRWKLRARLRVPTLVGTLGIAADVSSGEASGVVTSFTLTSSSGGSALQFALGHAFRMGDVPIAAALGADIAIQVTPKNYWPDGSLKYAIVSGLKTLTAGVAGSVVLSNGGTVASGSSLGTADLKATGITASIDCGAPGTVSWATTDWDAPFVTWVSGPAMSSWIYRKQVGSDAHLVGWLEVRLWSNGAVEVLPWIENGYVMVASPTNKSATYVFTLGGTQRFSAAIDLKHHQRTPLCSGSTFSHWLGTDPGIRPNHDKAYMQASGLVPSYRGAVAAGASVWSSLAQTYTPLQQGNYRLDMGDTGYSPTIGLLPQWDVLYLCSNDSRAYAGVICNSYSAGRYATHYRDEATKYPIEFSDYPNRVLGSGSNVADVGASTTSSYTPTPSGGGAPTWDVPHHPTVGYMAYLITGRRYFMEEVQFAASVNFLKVGDATRNFADGRFRTDAGATTPRGAAWALRTLALAATVTPDADTLAAEYLGSLKANADYYHGKYVASTANPFGFLAPYEDYNSGDSIWTGPAWQEDFFTACTGWWLALKPLMTGGLANLSAFFAWKANAIIGRLGGTASTDFLYRDAAQYTVAFSPSTSPDFDTGTGPWYSDWGAIYTATIGSANPGVAGDIRGGNYPEVTSYWGNLQPAIAYAVQHGVSGALTAYNRMVGAGNWATFSAGFNADPVWGVRPSTLPLWLADKAVNQGFAIANTRWDTLQISGRGQPFNYSGGGTDGNRLFVWGGGRADCNDNSMSAIDLSADVPAWSRLWGPTASGDIVSGNATWADGAPASRHSYGLGLYNPVDGLYHVLGGAGPPDVSQNINKHDAFDFTLAAASSFPWTSKATTPSGFTDSGTCVDASGNIYVANASAAANNGAVYKWTRSTDSVALWLDLGAFDGYSSMASDVANNRGIVCPVPGLSSPRELDFTAGTSSTITLNGDSIGSPSFSAAYDTFLQCYWLMRWSDGALFKLVRNSSTSYTATAVTPSGSGPGGTSGVTGYYPHNRFCYVSSLKGLAYSRNYDTNVWFMRTA